MESEADWMKGQMPTNHVNAVKSDIKRDACAKAVVDAGGSDKGLRVQYHVTQLCRSGHLVNCKPEGD